MSTSSARQGSEGAFWDVPAAAARRTAIVRRPPLRETVEVSEMPASIAALRETCMVLLLQLDSSIQHLTKFCYAPCTGR